LNADEVREFVEIHSLRRTPYPNPKELFRKTTDLFRLGDVYFNQRRTLALTAISTYCGSLCGSSTWKIFGKTPNGQWEEKPWVTCKSIALADHVHRTNRDFRWRLPGSPHLGNLKPSQLSVIPATLHFAGQSSPPLSNRRDTDFSLTEDQFHKSYGVTGE
jgi:hypothetical protein